MNQEDKRKREEEPMYSKITTAEWIRLVGLFDEAIKIRDIVDAVTHAVIEGQCIKHKQDFNNFLEPGSGEGSSDDSVDPNLCDWARTKEDLRRLIRITRGKRESIQHMLKHQQIHVVGNRVWSPLGNKLPDDKKTWMDDPIMRKAFFVPGRHSSSGLSGSKAFLTI